MGRTSLRYDLPATAARATLDSAGSMLDAADFDGDGLSELLSSGSQLRVFRGRAGGLRTTGMVTVKPPARGTTRVLSTGDFDGDGRADLVVRTYVGETKDTVAVFPGRPAKQGLLAAEPSVTFSSPVFLVR
jgi:hypothetical protein